MTKYTVSILDSDTMIERRITLEANDAYEAHKNTMMREIVDYELETITKIVDDENTVVYRQNQGFYETN